MSCSSLQVSIVSRSFDVVVASKATQSRGKRSRFGGSVVGKGNRESRLERERKGGTLLCRFTDSCKALHLIPSLFCESRMPVHHEANGVLVQVVFDLLPTTRCARHPAAADAW